jgi:hypothetical protein
MAFAALMMIAIPAHLGYMLGIGASSCGKWMEARKVRGTSAEAMHTSWVCGYLSAEAALLASDARDAVLLGKNSQTLIERADILNLSTLMQTPLMPGWTIIVAFIRLKQSLMLFEFFWPSPRRKRISRGGRMRNLRP